MPHNTKSIMGLLAALSLALFAPLVGAAETPALNSGDTAWMLTATACLTG